MPAYELQIAVQSDSVGVHPNDRVAALSLRIDLDCAGATRHLDLAAYCSPTVTVRSLFAVPNRPERVVLISYLGRSHDCEETDLPVILRP